MIDSYCYEHTKNSPCDECKTDILEARIKELEGEVGDVTSELVAVLHMGKDEYIKRRLSMAILQAQLEKLTKCMEPSRCPDWEDFNKCQGCKNKAVLENMESEG